MNRTPLPLPRVLAEGAVIVVSILLAFAIDAGWDARNERAAREDALVDLRGELRESLPLIDTVMARIETDLEYIRGMLTDPDATVAPLTAVQRGAVIEAVIRPNTADNNASGIDAVLADPRIRDLQDDGLRSATAAWRQQREETVERGGIINQTEADVTKQLAAEPEIERLFVGYRARGGGWTEPPSARTLIQLAGRPEVRVLMARKALYGEAQLGTFVLLREETEALITEVERLLSGG